MKKKNTNRVILVLGAALFSMFFGAGNLIFPPHLGLEAGTKWLPALLGFFITGMGLPLMGVVASAKSDGDVHELGRRVSPNFAKAIGILMVISIGPLVAIPRTGATAFEMGVQPLFSSFSPVLWAVIYFGITWLLVINPTNIVDKIGKVLTPGLLIILAAIIFKGVFNKIGLPIDTNVKGSFGVGFTGGYQTMDALASVLFGGMIIQNLKDDGYDKIEDQISMTIKAGVVAVLGLTFVYGGLGYLGATASGVYATDITRVDLIMKIAEHSLKSFGKVGLGLVVSLACLTTSTGLVSTVGTYFEDLTNGKLKYSWIVTATILFSGVLSVVGVEKIVAFADPILSLIYPIVIVLIVFAIIIGEDQSDYIYKISILFTGIISIIDLLSVYGFGFAKGIINLLPFSSIGLAWLVPAIIGAVLGGFIPDREKSTITES